jgi:carboxylesterase
MVAQGGGSGGTQPAAAIFIHGLGTTDLDLRPLAEAFAEQGVEGTLLTLAGHDEGEADLPSATASGWLEEVRHAVDAAMADHDTVYLVGFSLGAALALRVAAERDVAGVLCISAFARPAKPRALVRLGLALRNLPPIGSRRPRVSIKGTRDELSWASKLPTSTVKHVIDEVSDLAAVPRDRRVLFVHSVNDPVASYATVADLVRGASSDDVRLVTLTGLAHFIQFDIPSHALCRASLAHFCSDRNDPDREHPTWVENVKQREEEVRHWANVLSLLFLGFFTVFGTLARATLSDITAKDASAPYLLFGYALLIAVYLQFVFLYLFYMNRTQAYLRVYADPVQEGGIGWTFYRTARWVSGRASGRMTRFVTSSGAVLPFAAAIFAIAYAIMTYHARLFHLAMANLTLQILALVSVCWLIQVVYTGGTVVRYTRAHLYKVPPVVPASREFLEALRGIYASVQPGIVKQKASREGRAESRPAPAPAMVPRDDAQAG